MKRCYICLKILQINSCCFYTSSRLYVFQAIEIAQIMDESLDENDSELVLRSISVADSRMCSKANQSEASETLATFFSRFSASWIYSKVVSLGVSFFEREHRYKL